MLGTTTTAIKSILQADPSVTPNDRKKLLTVLRNGLETEKTIQTPEPIRILRRPEVAKKFSVSTRTIDSWVQSGILEKVWLPGRLRASGFRSSDVERLIRGTTDE